MTRTMAESGQGVMVEEGIAGALDLTAVSLKEGVLRLGVTAALPEVAAWQERLAASGDQALVAVAETLGELKAQLDPAGFDPVTVGALLMSLGEQVELVAGGEVGARVGERLSRLATLLGREGEEMASRFSRI